MKQREIVSAVTMMMGVIVMGVVMSGCMGHAVRKSEPTVVATTGEGVANIPEAERTPWRTLKEIVDEIQADAERLAGIHDAEQRMECADAVVTKTDMILAGGSMPKDARMQVETIRRNAQIIRDKASVMMEWERAEKAYTERNSYDEVTYALRRLKAAMGVVQHQEYLAMGDKMELEEMTHAIERTIENERKQYDESREKVDETLEQERRVFVNKEALRDCVAAQALLNAQKKKFMNIMGMRDNVTELVKAARLTARVLGDTRVDDPVQIRAAELHVTCTHRMGAQGRAMIASMPAIPGYSSMETYPDMTASEKHAMAEQIWRERERKTPVIDDGREQKIVEIQPARN